MRKPVHQHFPEGATMAGQLWLRRHFTLDTPPPYTQSYILASGTRRSEHRDDQVFEFYPPQYGPEPTVIAHLRFALRYETLDFRILAGSFERIDRAALEAWCRAEPQGAYARRAWFFYEWFTSRLLDLPDLTKGNYVPALDPRFYCVAERRNSPRHRVIDNMLGTPDLCMVVRKTPALADWLARDMSAEASAALQSYDPAVLSRAISYLYTAETRSSFEIEHERPGPDRVERFMRALRDAKKFWPSKEDLVALQESILDQRYVSTDWRDFQNFIGQAGYRGEIVNYICPKLDAVPSLMNGWFALYDRLVGSPLNLIFGPQSETHPVIAAALLAFSFVFIHPFADGNGRTHRYLIHAILAQKQFGPQNFIFPVSSAILRDRAGYEKLLESFSAPIMQHLAWRWTPDQEIEVTSESECLYKYFDATDFVTYLFEKIDETITTDLRDEVDYLLRFDAAMQAIARVIDMPDRHARILASLLLQNAGRLSHRKRDQFSELTDAELTAIEQALAEHGPTLS